MRIIGIDPALSITGYGVIEQANNALRLIEAGIVKTNSDYPLPQRLETIYKEVFRIVKQFSPDCLVLEKIYVHYRHPTTAYILGEARGIICLISQRAQIGFFEYSATRIKKAIVGKGLASKEQIQRMVAVTLGMPLLPKHKDVTDALALAIAHSYITRAKGCSGLRKSNFRKISARKRSLF